MSVPNYPSISAPTTPVEALDRGARDSGPRTAAQSCVHALDCALDRGDPVQREWSVLGANQAVSDEEVMHDPTLQPATNPHHGNGAARAALSARWRVPRARLSRSTRTATWVGKDTTATARRNSRPTCTRTWRPGARRRADAHLTGTAGPTASTPNYAAPAERAVVAGLRGLARPRSAPAQAPRRSHSTCSCRSGWAAANASANAWASYSAYGSQSTGSSSSGCRRGRCSANSTANGRIRTSRRRPWTWCCGARSRMVAARRC